MTKRPLDKGGAAREIELSNAMCARALGGSRKAWMSGNSQSSNGDPKTGINPTQRNWSRHGNTSMSGPVSIAEGIPQQNRAEWVASPETISTALPRTSFAVNPHDGPKSPQFQNVLPSPAPSEEHRQDNPCVIDPETEAEGRASNSRPVSATVMTPRVSSSIEREAEPSTYRTRGEQDPVVQENVQPSPQFFLEEPLRRVAERYGGLEETRERLGGSDAQLPSTAGESVAGPPSELNKARQTSMIAPSENPMNQAPPVLSDKPTYSEFLLRTTLTQFSQGISQRLNQIRNEVGHEVEGPRLVLLQEAIKKNDIFYVMLHQIYCLDFISPMPDAAVRNGFKATHSQGLMLLGQPLLENSKLKLDALQWFSNMPLSLERLFHASGVFRSTFAKLLAFLAQLSKHWTRVKDETKRRECPPSANEMAVMFGLQSPVLQIVLFRALLREIWPGAQDRCFTNCEKVFQHYQTSSSSQLMVPENQLFYNVINRTWAQHQTHTHHGSRQQLAKSQVNVPQMAPPQRRFSEATASSGHGAPFQRRPTQADTRNRPARISTIAPQQASSVSPGTYTPTVPSSPSRFVPITPTEHSRTPQQQLTSGQRSRTAAPLLTNLPPVQTSTIPVSTQGSDSRATASASLRWPSGQHRRASGAMLSDNQLQNHHTGRNQGSQPPIPQTSTTIPTQVPASGDYYLYQSNQLFSPQDNLAPSTFGSFANPHIGPPYSPPPSVVAQLGRPFLRPVSSMPVSTTDQSAFHQSHVTSPTLKVINATPSTDRQKYFMYLERVEMCPEQLHADKRYVKWTLDLCREDIDMLAKTNDTPVGHPSQLNAMVGSWLCRIRSVKVNDLAPGFTESDWVAASNVWPSGIAVILNGKALEIRKKLHHSKDLPINITSLLQEGQNSVSVAVSKIDDGSVYALAMETAQVTNTRIIKERISRLNWSEAKDNLLRYLNNTDSDVQVLNPTMILDLTDPFTSYMCCLPVRGKTCKHKQCFDLDIFLLTRNGKTNEPCGPDQFRCPICGADARPKNLFVDEFFVKVREELQQMGRLDVKAIVLDENGSWQIKEEEQIGESGDGTGRRKSEPADNARPPATRKESEIIDLDSDD
ncbi:MAG: hypothetical protein HETSPECPRED_001306 [Heterodermia speciosa]|uniref:SP-RING-type domain-containing protein n=1 Tax=Heterodermia speciosa TaxID=116794 RepID=A0A8H3ET91_9LECA|nr:MAG: hypothetical protein HETSPECPRED_001306 [Heterodermia speciosa]